MISIKLTLIRRTRIQAVEKVSTVNPKLDQKGVIRSHFNMLFCSIIRVTISRKTNLNEKGDILLDFELIN